MPETRFDALAAGHGRHRAVPVLAGESGIASRVTAGEVVPVMRGDELTLQLRPRPVEFAARDLSLDWKKGELTARLSGSGLQDARLSIGFANYGGGNLRPDKVTVDGDAVSRELREPVAKALMASYKPSPTVPVYPQEYYFVQVLADRISRDPFRELA